MKYRAKKKSGFTLIETIICLVIVTTLLVSISNMVIGAKNRNEESERKQQGAEIGQAVLEEIRAIDSVTLDINGEFKLVNEEVVKLNGSGFTFISNSTYKKKYGVTITSKKENQYAYKAATVSAGNLRAIPDVYTEADRKDYDCIITLLNNYNAAFNDGANVSYSSSDNLMLDIGLDFTCKLLYKKTQGIQTGTLNTSEYTEIGRDKPSSAQQIIGGFKDKGKILIYLSDMDKGYGIGSRVPSPYNLKQNIVINNEFPEDLVIDVVKGNGARGDANLSCTYSAKKPYVNYYGNNTVVDNVGDLYTFNVEVKLGEDIIFSGTTTKNLIVN